MTCLTPGGSQRLGVGDQDIGAIFDVFQKVPNTNFQTSVYVFSVHPSTGVVHFAFGRKVPAGTRVPFGWQSKNRGANPATAPATILQGAAGTDRKWHGKWASLGGGADRKATTPLVAAIMELNDEAAIKPAFDPNKEVYVPWVAGPVSQTATHRLVLVSADQPNKNKRFYSFVFKMPNWNEFLKFFPHVDDRVNVRGGQALVTASHGEIDYTASFSPEDIAKYQNIALASSPPVNFFTSYTLATLKSHAIQAAAVEVRKMGGSLVNVTAIQSLTILRDVDPRKSSGWRNPPGMRYF